MTLTTLNLSGEDSVLVDCELKYQKIKPGHARIDLNLILEPVYIEEQFFVVPECWFGYRNVYIKIQMQTSGEISEHTKSTAVIKVDFGSEQTDTRATFTLKPKMTAGEGSVEVGEFTPKNRMIVSKLSFQDYEAKLVAKSGRRSVSWDYTMTGQEILRKYLLGNLLLFFEWTSSDYPVMKGKLYVSARKMGVFGPTGEEVGWLQSNIIKYMFRNDVKNFTETFIYPLD